jgi:hypothetical protein
LALQACVEVANALGWQPREDSSEAEFQTFQLKAEEKLRSTISDGARLPSPAAVRQAIRQYIFFEDAFQASIKDG